MKAIEGGVLLLSGQSMDALASALESTTFSDPLFDDDPRGLRLSMALQTASTSFDAIIHVEWLLLQHHGLNLRSVKR